MACAESDDSKKDTKTKDKNFCRRIKDCSIIFAVSDGLCFDWSRAVVECSLGITLNKN